MLIQDLMNPDVVSCRPGDTLEAAARIMWDHDCGSVPVVDEQNHVVGVITDRDICMAALTQGVTLASGHVASAMARDVECIRSDECPALAETAMQRRQVRRLPVVDAGGRLIGIVSLADLAYTMESGVTFGADGMTWGALGRTLAAVSRPRRSTSAAASVRVPSAPPSSGASPPLDPLGAFADSF